MHGARQKRPDLRTLIALCCGLALNAHAGLFSARAIAVIDGDTLMVLREDGQKLKLRLANIDAPEKSQPFGKQSRLSLQEMVGKKQVQVDSRAVDQYGRIIALVTVDGVDVNRTQVRLGYAWAGASWQRNRRSVPDAPEGQTTGEFQAGEAVVVGSERTYISLQHEARQARRGLWVQDSPQAPWQWRKQHPLVSSLSQVPRAANIQAKPVNPSDMQCGRKTHCAQMTSCAEAHYYFNRCGLKSLDFNGDGKPCESLCRGKR